jgi:hypothetical protein
MTAPGAPWSVDAECCAVVNQNNGTDKCLLRTDVVQELNGDHIVTSLSRSRGTLERLRMQ